MKIAITGGHITPALAVIVELLKDEKNRIIYFGRKYSFEGEKIISNDAKIVSQIKGLKYINLETGRLQRQFTRYTLISLLKIPSGFWQAYQELKKNPVDVILSFGGYLAFPVAVAGFLQKIPVISHEQTVTVGLSNRLISFIASKILVSWSQSLSHFSEKKAVLVGNPVRQEIIGYQLSENRQEQKKLKSKKLKELLENKKKLIYITGGNQGAQVINEAVWEILLELLKDYTIIHQCGQKDWDRVKNGEVKIEIADKLQDRYYLAPWIETQEVAAIMNNADLVISRAGGNTVYELACLGKPTLFIPIPWVVNNEQQKNAQLLSDAGVARIMSQNDLKPMRLKKVVDEIFEKIESYRQKGEEYKSQMIHDAAARIVIELQKIASKS